MGKWVLFRNLIGSEAKWKLCKKFSLMFCVSSSQGKERVVGLGTLNRSRSTSVICLLTRNPRALLLFHKRCGRIISGRFENEKIGPSTDGLVATHWQSQGAGTGPRATWVGSIGKLTLFSAVKGISFRSFDEGK